MRTIPRDLFNQANLLENLGRLYIALEENGLEHIMKDDEPLRDSFEMIVDEGGNTQSIEGVYVEVQGERFYPYRTINSRER